MKILLVHPDDSVEAGPWTETRWNLIVDLGWSGRSSYARQAEHFGCRVLSIYDLLDHERHRRRLCEILGLGLNRVVDSESIDWWDVVSTLHYQRIEQLMLLGILAEQIPDDAEIFATRTHFLSSALSTRLQREIRVFLADRQTGIGAAAGRYMKAVSALRASQLAEIAFDKWDTGYRLRRLVSRRPPASTAPAVLLPSAYVNVSRAQLAYAQMLPHRRFLLVVTRPSGRRLQIPANVELRSLASYAPGFSRAIESEGAGLLRKWRELLNDRLARDAVLGLATKLGMFEGFGSLLQSGLRVREAWHEVIAREPITALLSADEHNRFTRFPIVLARTRKLRTVFCDHGALNMSFGIRPACSDIYLASGEMARDYMIEWCGLRADKVVVGGPLKGHRPLPSSGQQGSGQGARDWIVFFSEQYEISSARTQTLYSELLPELCWLARQNNRKVIVKLHPFESLRMRKAIIDKVVPAEQRGLIEMRAGPMTPDLFERAWFSITVESSVAVESTSNGVPCFLCGWFDVSWYDYVKQYAKYDAGHLLDSPESVRQIPQRLDGIKITDATRQALHTFISPDELDSILFRA